MAVISSHHTKPHHNQSHVVGEAKEDKKIKKDEQPRTCQSKPITHCPDFLQQESVNKCLLLQTTQKRETRSSNTTLPIMPFWFHEGNIGSYWNLAVLLEVISGWNKDTLWTNTLGWLTGALTISRGAYWQRPVAGWQIPISLHQSSAHCTHTNSDWPTQTCFQAVSLLDLTNQTNCPAHCVLAWQKKDGGIIISVADAQCWQSS